MNRQADLQSWLESAQNCVLQVIRPCFCWLQRQRQVHPAASSPSGDSQFVQLSSHRRIRVIHIDANRRKSSGWHMNGAGMEMLGLPSEQCHYSSIHKNLSLVSNYSELSSEDYWFTRWNRPLRISDPCSCSFRKSWGNLLGDSRLKLNQTQEETNAGTGQLLDSVTLRENCVDEGKLPSRRHKLLQIETFVEEVLQEVWNEVFSCLSQIGHMAEDSCELKMKDMCQFISIQHNNGLELDYVCRVKGESVGNYQFINDFNCQTVISCHETAKSCQVVENVNNLDGTNNQQLVSTSLKSVGCVNPTFLGSSTNPDLLDHPAVPHATVVDCDASSLNKGVPGFDGEDTKCFSDSDSGFNTVSLESTNHRTNGAGCFKIDGERSSAGQPMCGMESTQTESYTVDPNEIQLTELQANVSVDSHYNDKTIETKDITQEYNQSTFTSVDIRLPETCRTQDSGFADVGPKSQKSNMQQIKSKQCYHARRHRRVVSDIFTLSGIRLLIMSVVVHSLQSGKLHFPDSLKV